MIVIGLDASTTSTGYAVFDGIELIDCGCIKPLGEDWRERLVNQGDKIREIIKLYNPEKIIMEDVPLKSKILKTLVILGAVQGFICGIASNYNVPIEFILPTQWRAKINLFDGTKEGLKREELKRKSIEKANELFKLNLKWVSPNSIKNEDDIADAILVAYSQIKPRKFGK